MPNIVQYDFTDLGKAEVEDAWLLLTVYLGEPFSVNEDSMYCDNWNIELNLIN